MSEDVLRLFGDNLQHFAIVFARLSAFFALLPAFGEQSVPARIKLALAFAMSLVVAPAVIETPQTTALLFAIIPEILIGAALGFALRLFVIALQVAGVIAAQSTSLAQLFAGASAEPLPALGHILVISGITLLVILGFHVKATEFFVLSYDLFPMGQYPSADVFSDWGTSNISRAFGLAFSLAAPFVILGTIYNLALGAINRAMPQLMVAFVGAPLITMGSLVLLLISAPFALQAWVLAVDSFLGGGG